MRKPNAVLGGISLFKKRVDASFAGQEWAGEYTVEVIYAPESLQMYSEVAKEMQKKGADPRDMQTLQTLLNWKLIKYCVKKDGQPLPDRIPHKLYEFLAPEAHKLNTITLEEGRELFLSPTTNSRRKKKLN